jgi:hypothetical protein
LVGTERPSAAIESLLTDGADHLAVLQQACGSIMPRHGYAEYVNIASRRTAVPVFQRMRLH